MNYLTVEEILRLHSQIIEDYGGSHGVRDERRLQAVIAAVQQAVFGVEQYQTVYHKAATYLRNLAGDHPFIDGNKLTATTVCGIFLMMNGKQLHVSPKVLEDFVVAVVTEQLSVPTIAAWLETYSG